MDSGPFVLRVTIGAVCLPPTRWRDRRLARPSIAHILARTRKS